MNDRPTHPAWRAAATMQHRPRQLPAGGCGKWQQQAALPQESRHPHRTSFTLVLWALHAVVSALRTGKCALAPLATGLPPSQQAPTATAGRRARHVFSAGQHSKAPAQQGVVACYAAVLPHTRTRGRWSTARQLWLAALVRHATTPTVAGTTVAWYRLCVGACVIVPMQVRSLRQRQCTHTDSCF